MYGGLEEMLELEFKLEDNMRLFALGWYIKMRVTILSLLYFLF